MKAHELLEQQTLIQVDQTCKKLGLDDYTVNPDGTVTTNDYVNTDNWRYRPTMFPVQFKESKSSFKIIHNMKSLVGSPQLVDGSFVIDGLDIKNLDGGPSEIRENLYMSNCPNLTSLKGFPKKVHSFLAQRSNIETLEGMPEHFQGFIDLVLSVNLKSLKGIPKIVEQGYVNVRGCVGLSYYEMRYALFTDFRHTSANSLTNEKLLVDDKEIQRRFNDFFGLPIDERQDKIPEMLELLKYAGTQ